MKITQDEFLSLYSDTITKKNYDAILVKITDRFDEIIRKNSISFQWWDYNNESEDRQGCFEPNTNRADSTIEFHGDFKLPEPFDYRIPVRWLWEDYEEEFKAEVKKYQKKEEEKKEKLKLVWENKKNLIKQIKSKLTKEELTLINFK